MSDMNPIEEAKIHKASAEGEMALRAAVLKSKTKSESSVEKEAKAAGPIAPEPEIEGELGSKSARPRESEIPQRDASEGGLRENASAEGGSSKPTPTEKKASKDKDASSIISEFMSVLQEAEKSRDPEAIASLFDEDAELWRQNFPKGQQSDSAAMFWKQYLEKFKDVKSSFTKVQELSGLAVLEWESEGHLKNGEGFHYAGVSILNYEGEGKITSFKTYFDSSALSMKARDAAH